jgi:hypothetical protein
MAWRGAEQVSMRGTTAESETHKSLSRGKARGLSERAARHLDSLLAGVRRPSEPRFAEVPGLLHPLEVAPGAGAAVFA